LKSWLKINNRIKKYFYLATKSYFMLAETLHISIQKIAKSRLAETDFSDIHFGKIFSDHMFQMDYEDEQWKNAKIIPYEKLQMSPSLAVIHYGQSIFEGMKAYKNEKGEVFLFRPLENYERFNRSAKRMCMPEISEEAFMEGIRQLVLLDKDWIPTEPGCSLYIRPVMFASDEFLGVRPSDTYKFMIITSPSSAYYSAPIKVLVERKYARAFEGGTGYVKASGNYGRSLYPSKIAQEKGYQQLIWTDAFEHKFIEESGTMNVIFQVGDALITPPVSNTILPGVTRDSVLTIARDMGITVEERKISIDELVEAHGKGLLKDAFGTGTAATIAPFELIGFEGEDYVLPPVAERTLSRKIHEELQAIRFGKAEDKHKWAVKIN
jgi:branched-chain amino acid aminotransferase